MTIIRHSGGRVQFLFNPSAPRAKGMGTFSHFLHIYLYFYE